MKNLYSSHFGKFSIVAIILASFPPISLASDTFSQYESFAGQGPARNEFLGMYERGQFGAAFEEGDFNADGYMDLLVSAPFTSSGQKQYNGAVSVIFGDEDGFGTVNDLRSGEVHSVGFYGENSGDQLGTALTVGDFNGDSIDDIAMSAPSALVGEERKGKVYIIHGGNNFDKSVVGVSTESVDKVLTGKVADSAFGLALSSVDINVDKADDLLIGVPGKDLVEVHFGSTNGLSTDVVISIYGQIAGERFGSKIVAGDVLGDDKTDLIISAHKAGNSAGVVEAGKIYVFEGPINFAEIRDYDYALEGSEEKEWFGFALDSGDLNGDGKDDIVSGSFPFYGLGSGQARIHYGAAEFDLTSDVTITEPLGETKLGAGVAVGDFNGDGLKDLALGAPAVSQIGTDFAGDVYVFYQGEEGFSGGYEAGLNASSVIHGENADDWFGYRVGTMNLNGDSFDDLTISARYADRPNMNNSGKVFVFRGNSERFGNEKELQVPSEEEKVSRGQLIKMVLESFALREERAEDLENCYKHRDFCLYNFAASSLYDDLDLETLDLYPDVNSENEYYQDIVDGTMLGIVNGFMNLHESPFYPEQSISRIQALKIILSGGGLVPPKYKFELASILGSYESIFSQKTIFADVDAAIEYMWWYPRYLNFALEKGIIEESEFFRPDENITVGEVEEMLNNTLRYLKSQHEETDISGDLGEETDSASGEEAEA